MGPLGLPGKAAARVLLLVPAVELHLGEAVALALLEVLQAELVEGLWCGRCVGVGWCVVGFGRFGAHAASIAVIVERMERRGLGSPCIRPTLNRPAKQRTSTFSLRGLRLAALAASAALISAHCWRVRPAGTYSSLPTSGVFLPAAARGPARAADEKGGSWDWDGEGQVGRLGGLGSCTPCDDWCFDFDRSRRRHGKQ